MLHKFVKFVAKLAPVLTPLFVLACASCGGAGSSSQPPPPPPSPDFSLNVSPASESLTAGNSVVVTLSATAENGFSSTIAVSVTGVPVGISVSPSKVTLSPGNPQKVTISAPPLAETNNGVVIFTGSAPSLQHTAQVSLSVAGPTGPLSVRTQYVRTDATTEYLAWNNQHWLVYDASLARYFVTDPSSNQIIVIDGTSHTKLSTIAVPGAFGIDETPDHSTLYVGTLIGDVYAVDPVAMTVRQRYPASQIGPSGFPASYALVLSNGQLALVDYSVSVFYGTNSTSLGGVAVWDPASNNITVYGGAAGQQGMCGNGIGFPNGFALNANRTKILIGSGSTLCEIDPQTGTSIYTSVPLADPTKIIVTPDGRYVILAANLMTGNSNAAAVFDASTLAPVEQFNVLGDTSSAAGLFVSADSTTLFTPGDPETGLIYAYDLATQQMIGWAPNIFVRPISGGGASGPINSPYLLVSDGTGRYAGPLEEGIGFVDLSVLQTGPPGAQFNTAAALSPAAGPISGGTVTQWIDEGPLPLESIYFGTQQATAISSNPANVNTSNVNISATSPGGPAGPVDVYLFTTDGGMQLLPEAFSYGPRILQVTPNMATAEGGGTGYVYGYGFGPANANSIPQGLSVTVNGVVVPITAYSGSAYGSSSPPFPLQSVGFTIPSGTTGSSVDVSITTPTGVVIATRALTYLPPTQTFPLKGSALAQGVYDSNTDLYYFTDATQLQVFSRIQGKWLTPIAIAPPPGATERLWGIALSPSGNLMAIADVGAGAIYTLDPTSPSSVKTFPTTSLTGRVLPAGVAVSDSGQVYYTGTGGSSDFFKLDTVTGSITDYGVSGPQVPSEALLRTAISSDNARVFFNDQGWVFGIDTATDAKFAATINGACCNGNYELALSSDQTQFTANFYIYDYSLNGESYYALNDREIMNTQYVYGAKFSPDGRLLFQPSASGVDVFGNGPGNLQTRIALSVSLSANYDALVSDGADNMLVGITGTGDGVAIMDFTSLNEPQPLPNDHIPSLPSDRFTGPNIARRNEQPRQGTNLHLLSVPHLVRPVGSVK